MILVFDYTNRQSFDRLDFWREEIITFGSKNVFVILVGNKIDLVSEFKVNDKEAQKYADKNGYFFFKTSAS